MLVLKQPPCLLQAEAEPERNQGRYNLRRRKDDTKAAKAPEPDEEKEAKPAAAPAAAPSTPLDFGGKMGRLLLQGGDLHCSAHRLCDLSDCPLPQEPTSGWSSSQPGSSSSFSK